MKVYDYSFQPIDSRMYLVIEKGEALVIDPCVSPEAFALLHREQVSRVLILLTHEHYDHISGVNAFKENFACEVLCSRKCARNIQDPLKNVSKFYDALFIGKKIEKLERTKPYACTATQEFEDEYSMEWKGHRLFLKETPGHSEGSICILLDEKILFTGDSLLLRNKVTTRSLTGNKEMYEAITRPFLEKIAPEVYIYPGHGENGARSEFAVG